MVKELAQLQMHVSTSGESTGVQQNTTPKNALQGFHITQDVHTIVYVDDFLMRRSRAFLKFSKWSPITPSRERTSVPHKT